MSRNGLLICYDKDLRLHVNYPEARKEITDDVVRFIRKAPGMNFVSYTFADEASLWRTVNRQVESLAVLGQPFSWKVYEHDRLSNIEGILRANGFVEDDAPATVMLLDVRLAPAESEAAGLEIRRITDRDGLNDIVHVLDRVYGGRHLWVHERMGLHLDVPGYLSAYAAYVDDQPVSIAWTYFPGRHFATLHGGTTLAEYRHRGFYTALLRTRLNEIRARGCPYAVVEAGPMSQPIVAKHGFQRLTTVWDYEWKGN